MSSTQPSATSLFPLSRFLVLLVLLMMGGTSAYRWVADLREGPSIQSCQTNLKQLGLGIAMYSQDYGDRLPVARSFPSLAEVISPYVKNN